MKTGVRGIVRDILIIYICIRLVLVWLFDAPFDFVLGIMVVLLGLSAIWFMIERIGLVG
jgi:RsiW-degrading membrane proteinase PrsW (M82 family)